MEVVVFLAAAAAGVLVSEVWFPGWQARRDSARRNQARPWR